MKTWPRRIARWLVNAAAAVSLVIVLGMVILWARSYRHSDSVDHNALVPGDMPSVATETIWRSSSGRLGFYTATVTTVADPGHHVRAPTASAPKWRSYSTSPPSPQGFFPVTRNRLGFGWETAEQPKVAFGGLTYI